MQMSFTADAFLDDMDNEQEVAVADMSVQHAIDFSHLMPKNSAGWQAPAEIRQTFTNQAVNRQINYVQESPVNIDYSQFDKL